MSKKKMKLKHRTEEEVSKMDRGAHLWDQLHEGTQAMEPEAAAEVEVLRTALYDAMGCMTDWRYSKDTDDLLYLRNLASWAHHYRQLITIHFADLRGHEVDPEDRELWFEVTKSDEWKKMMERYLKQEGEAVH